MQDLLKELNSYRSDLDSAITIIRERKIEKARAEREYRVELAKEITRLRADGIPVTIISDLCRGNERIAKLREDKDIAEGMYESNMQFIYRTKINIDIVREHIQAESKGV